MTLNASEYIPVLNLLTSNFFQITMKYINAVFNIVNTVQK